LEPLSGEGAGGIGGAGGGVVAGGGAGLGAGIAAADVACGASGLPHSPQNLAPGAANVPHCGQLSGNRVPHCPQNFEELGFSAAQTGQRMTRHLIVRFSF
jgi:hypothetical protein